MTVSKVLPLVLGLSLLAVCFALIPGCQEKPTSKSTQGSSILAEDRQDTSAVLVESISRTLNHLPGEVVTVLTPPRPILDDSRSADGQPVMAVLGRTPGVADSPFNYLSVPEGNGNFRTLQVQAGDIVRYFVKYDQEDLEHGYENLSYLELVVRRLDVNNPQNALIVEGGLSAMVDFPHRIEIWRFSDRRMREIHTRLNRYLEKPRDMFAWEPSPDESALVQLADRLNQWWRNLPPAEQTFEVDPRVAQIPQSLLAQEPLLSVLDPGSLSDNGFDLWEMRLLQQAVWLRDIAAWAKETALSDLEVARALFDWTTSNIQLDAPGEDTIVHHPWQALMYGHGSAEDRAWVFAELCRHQNLDVVMLAIEGAEGPQWWLPALLSDDQLHLFDARLGIPLPGPTPESVATLSKVIADPSLLDSLQVEGELPYAFASDSLQEGVGSNITAWLVGSPLQLARRAVMLQDVLDGENFVALAADTATLAERVSTLEAVDRIALWPYPFQSLVDQQNMPRDARLAAVQRFLVFAQRPKLWKARVLHFQGTKDIPLSERNDPLAQSDFGHRRATQLYQDPGTRPSERTLRSLEPAKQVIYRLSKYDAGYWLGLLKAAEGNPSVAIQWLDRQTLKAVPQGPWTPGARFNLARCYEAIGETDKAIELLEADDSPQRLGNLIRARQLRESLEQAEDKSEPDGQSEP